MTTTDGQSSPLHVVQVGYDDSLFAENAPSDTWRRQSLYADLLVEKRPGSRLTMVVVTPGSRYRPVTHGPLTCIPVAGRGVLRPWRLFRQLLRLNTRRPIDVIATQTIFVDAWIALAVARWIDAKVIGQVHFDIFSPWAQVETLGGRWQAPWRMAIAMRCLRRLSVVRVTARRMRSEILTRKLHSKVVVLPMPASIPSASSGPPARADGSKRVLFVGRLVLQKNLRRWLRVAKLVHQQEPEVEFQWAGDGPLSATLLAEAEHLGLRPALHWLGPVPYEQLPNVFNQATVFLLTSNYEGLPRVVMEAGLQGLPVVSTRIMGVEDIVADGDTGFLHEPDDEAGLAASVLRLLRDPALCARMGVAARARVQLQFDLRTWAEQWVELLISVAEGRRMTGDGEAHDGAA